MAIDLTKFYQKREIKAPVINQRQGLQSTVDNIVRKRRESESVDIGHWTRFNPFTLQSDLTDQYSGKWRPGYIESSEAIQYASPEQKPLAYKRPAPTYGGATISKAPSYGGATISKAESIEPTTTVSIPAEPDAVRALDILIQDNALVYTNKQSLYNLGHRAGVPSYEIDDLIRQENESRKWQQSPLAQKVGLTLKKQAGQAFPGLVYGKEEAEGRQGKAVIGLSFEQPSPRQQAWEKEVYGPAKEAGYSSKQLEQLESQSPDKLATIQTLSRIAIMGSVPIKSITTEEATEFMAKAAKSKLTRQDLINVTRGTASKQTVAYYEALSSSPKYAKFLSAIAKNKKIPLSQRISDYLRNAFNLERIGVRSKSPLKLTSGVQKGVTQGVQKGATSVIKAETGVIPLTKPIPKALEPLAKEARKYESAEEFVKAQGTRTGVEVRDKIGTKLQDPYTAEYLPINNDGTITLYHSTTKEGAEKIKQSGLLGSKTEGGDIYFTTNKKGYGGIGKDKDVVLAFNVDPKKVKFDDVYRGELHLKGNNADISGIKPVEIKTKSQLTDIWNKAQATKKAKPKAELPSKPAGVVPKLPASEELTSLGKGARAFEDKESFIASQPSSVRTKHSDKDIANVWEIANEERNPLTDENWSDEDWKIFEASHSKEEVERMAAEMYKKVMEEEVEREGMIEPDAIDDLMLGRRKIHTPKEGEKADWRETLGPGWYMRIMVKEPTPSQYGAIIPEGKVGVDWDEFCDEVGMTDSEVIEEIRRRADNWKERRNMLILPSKKQQGDYKDLFFPKKGQVAEPVVQATDKTAELKRSQLEQQMEGGIINKPEPVGKFDNHLDPETINKKVGFPVDIANRTTKSGNKIPAIRKSGFYATKDFEEAPIRDVYKQSEAPHHMALMQDKYKLGGKFGLVYKKMWLPTMNAVVDAKEAKTTFDKSFLGILKKHSFKTTKKNGVLLSDWLENKVATPKQRQPLVNDVRKYLDSQREKANVVRASLGKKAIGYIKDYVPHLQRAVLWNNLISNKATISDNLDFIIPNEAKNPFAMHRLLQELPKAERNFFTLVDRYNNAIVKDIYITPAIENLKAHNAILKDRSLFRSAQYWDEYIRQGLVGKQHKIDTALSVGYKGRKGLQKWNSMVNLAFLTGKVAWNLATQPLSYITLTPTEAGYKNALKAIFKMFDKGIRKTVKEQSVSLKIKSKDVLASAIGEGRSSLTHIYRTPIQKYNNILSVISSLEEQILHEVSFIAGLDRAKQLGYKGQDAINFADLVAQRTQSMYNRENRALILNSDTTKAVFPFQSFAVEMWNHVKEISTGAGGAERLNYRQRFGKLLRLLAGIYLGNLYAKMITGRKKTTVGTFVPFFGQFVDALISKATGKELYSGRSPFTVIQQAEEIIQGSKDFIKYGDARRLRKVGINFGSAAVGVGGGGQLNNIIDGTMADIDEEVRSVDEKKLFEVKDVTSKIKAPIFGVWATKEGREYWNKSENKEKALKQIRKKIQKGTATSQDIGNLIQSGYLKSTKKDIAEFIQDSKLPNDIREFKELNTRQQVLKLKKMDTAEISRYLPYAKGGLVKTIQSMKINKEL